MLSHSGVIKLNFTFKADECFLIGSFAYSKNDTINAFNWLKIGFERLGSNKRLPDKSLVKTVEELIDSAIRVNIIFILSRGIFLL